MTAPKFEWEPEMCVEVFHRMRNSITVVLGCDAVYFVGFLFYYYHILSYSLGSFFINIWLYSGLIL